MRKLLFFLFVNTTFLVAFAQEEHAWVYFKDKPNASDYISSPLTMLTQRALDRRIRQHIAIDNKDVPITISYYNQIKNASGITILAKSKWLNAVHVLGTVSTINALKNTFTFIDNIVFANKTLNSEISSKKISKKTIKHQNKFKNSIVNFDYGEATNQIEMINGHTLHEKGFTGEGMQIAVIDAGFPNVNTLEAFSRLRENNQILGGYDFVDRTENFYTANSHGTLVLSDIAANIEEEFIGTAPDASFYLFRTEDAASETPLEESLWVEAAERADSLGVDIINTSLGYTTFDNASYNYSYEDMDGKTTFISRGANIAATRGMLLVNSAGNSGSSAWKYIGAPADVENVFSIGAVNADEVIASFSSFGPTVDGRVKPDVLAQGQSTYVINPSTGISATSNGTSFSSPIMAGAIACFWQAFPEKTNLEIMQIIRESADRYTNPTAQHGYGIPNFETAYDTTLKIKENNIDFKNLSIFPNPAEDFLTISIDENRVEEYQVIIYTILGEIILDKTTNSNQLNISSLSSGFYIVKILEGEKDFVFNLIKK